MDRQRREDELKGRSSKKGSEAEQSILNRVMSYGTCVLYLRMEVVFLFLCMSTTI